MASHKAIVQVFENYQKARITFVQQIADLALRPQNVDVLDSGNILDLLRPLLTDVCIQVQQCAAIGLGRILHQRETIALKALNMNVLSILLTNIQNKNKYQKKAILFVLRSICKHGEDLCRNVVNSGGMPAVLYCLEDFEPIVKEAAAWVIGYVARTSKDLAHMCVQSGAVPLLVLCLQEPDLSLKQIAASALADIAKHSLEMAQTIEDAGAIPHLARNLNNTDEKLKRQVLYALSSCAKHSTEMAEVIVEAELFPLVLIHLAHSCALVAKNAACLVRDVVKHSLELAQLVANTGGIGALLEVIQHTDGDCRIPSITALGYMAAHSEQLAKSIISNQGVNELTKILYECQDDATLAVTVWALGQVGKHSPEHAQEVANGNTLVKILNLYNTRSSSEDMKFKAKSTLKTILQRCVMLSALEPLLYEAPQEILKYVLGQYSKVLPHDPKARRLFVTTGALKRIQEIDAKPGSTLLEYISVINASFPDEIVRYYSPGYPETLLDKVEQYSPQMATVFKETRRKDSDLQTDVSVLLDDTASSISQDVIENI
ncbi:sperm-associated antigen 6-like [Coccinella septempunctata]|uniref:sperm-associated antigen 6-like n=1 Tax=Coccinella septempunctata TaxID=41139 RepID=UPI001D087EEB|nr:sperm-associated antigen 6-like [Coccinella septempunctata]